MNENPFVRKILWISGGKKVEDALILTIRWPSIPEDKKEPVQSGVTDQE